MIDLVDPTRRVVFRFDTDNQAAVENFCLLLGSNYHGNKNSMWFSDPEDKKPDKYSTVLVKVKIVKNRYRYTIIN